MNNNILTVSQFCQRNQAFTEGGLRWLIFQQANNGLDQSRAIVRIGRRVLIDEELFFEWVRNNQSNHFNRPPQITA